MPYRLLVAGSRAENTNLEKSLTVDGNFDTTCSQGNCLSNPNKYTFSTVVLFKFEISHD